MSARKLRNRVRAEREALRQRLALALDAWQRAWAFDAPSLELSTGQPDALQADPNAPWRVLGVDQTGVPDVFFRLTQAPQELAARWLGLPLPGVRLASTQRAPIASTLAQRAYDALLNAVNVEIGCTASDDDAAGDAWRALARPWSGAVLVNSSAAGVGIEWLLSAAIVDHLSPRRPSAAPRARDALVPVPDALAARKLVLTAELDRVALSLGDLAELRAGDVITLGHRLDMPLNVTDRAGSTFFGGFLVARNGRKSLKLSSDTPANPIQH